MLGSFPKDEGSTPSPATIIYIKLSNYWLNLEEYCNIPQPFISEYGVQWLAQVFWEHLVLVQVQLLRPVVIGF